VVDLTPVPRLVATTWALETTAPLESVTTPRRSPLVVCALSNIGSPTTAITTSTVTILKKVFIPALAALKLPFGKLVKFDRDMESSLAEDMETHKF
jgi:hypothetical protein